MQIESIRPQASQLPGYFGINLNFYNRDADVSKIVIVTFDCKELVDPDEESNEEYKAGEARQAKVVKKNDNKDLAQLYIEMSLS